MSKTKDTKPKKEKKPSDKLADKTALEKFLQGIFGDAQKKTLKRLYKKVQEINKLEPKYQKMSDEELADQTEILKEKLNKLTKKSEAELAKEKLKDSKDQEGSKKPKKVKDTSKESLQKSLDAILPDTFALCREATFRVLGMRHYDVQMIGGIALHEGNVAEMKTGEGKTLVALLPAVLNALSGRGVHVVTVNDYLAQRDAGWNGPVYNFLGLSVGVIINNASFVYDK